MLPDRIESAIGYEGWTALSWALHHGWVQDYKHLLSEREGKDVGVPATIDIMLHPEMDKHGILSNGARCMFPERVKIEDYDKLRRLMIEGYLLGTDFVSHGLGYTEEFSGKSGVVPDRDGEDQLEGELRRFWARQLGVSPADVELNHDAVFNYCDFHRLDGVYRPFLEHLLMHNKLGFSFDAD